MKQGKDIDRHEQLITRLHNTFIQKNHDYGNSFSNTFQEFGFVSAMVRMSDKWNRLKQLAMGQDRQVKDESIRDTLMDLANYCLLTVMEMDKQDDEKSSSEFEAESTSPVRTSTLSDVIKRWE